jgi:hypothetical protein
MGQYQKTAFGTEQNNVVFHLVGLLGNVQK